MYLIETHYHTPETSYCCKAAPAEAFPKYADNGYSAIAITDHYTPGWFDPLHKMSWEQKIDKWLAGYRAARETAQRYGLTIILGMELRLTGSSNEYLVYGLNEPLLYQHPELFKMKPGSFRDFADKHGLFFAQAHPFRTMCKPIEPENLHGVEVYNGNPRHANNNPMAHDFAEKNQLTMLSGSDFHQIEDACQGGIYLSASPHDSEELASLLFKGCVTGHKTSN